MRNYFLETERVAFSLWTQDDYNLALLLWGDESVTKYISKTGVFTEQEILDRLNTELENEKQFKVQYWPFFEKTTGDFIGCCGLRPYDVEKYIYEIGFHLRSKYWGKGFASEAARAIIQYSSDKLKLSELFAGHNPNNTDSKRILEKLEFQYIKDEYYKPTGLYHPSYKYILHTNYVRCL